VWIIASSIFGFISFISLFLLLLPLQIALIFISDTQIKAKQKVVVSRLLVLSGLTGFVIAFWIEVPLWYTIFILLAQGAFIYAELKILIEAGK
jgi:hypothetical protein